MKETFNLANKLGWMQIVLVALKVADISVLNWTQTFVPSMLLGIIFVSMTIYITHNIEKTKKQIMENLNGETEKERLDRLDEIFKNHEV